MTRLLRYTLLLVLLAIVLIGVLLFSPDLAPRHPETLPISCNGTRLRSCPGKR